MVDDCALMRYTLGLFMFMVELELKDVDCGWEGEKEERCAYACCRSRYRYQGGMYGKAWYGMVGYGMTCNG